MKKGRITALVTAYFIVFGLLFTQGIAKEQGIRVTIAGVQQQYDQMPVMENDRVLVPMRGIFEALGAEISWDDAAKTVTAKKGETIIACTIDNRNAQVDGAPILLDAAPKLVNGRTMVPVRFVSEALGAAVRWNASTNTVAIKMPVETPEVEVASIPTLEDAPNILASPDDRRPIPTEFETGSTKEDLIFFDMNSASPEELISRLPKGETIADENALLNAPLTGDFGTKETVDVADMPFSKAVQFTTTKQAPNSYDFHVQVTPSTKLETGDICLVTIYSRLVSGGDSDTSTGKIEVAVQETETGEFNAALKKEITVENNWGVRYLAFTVPSSVAGKALRIQVRPGFYKQVVEVGGFSVVNYKQSIAFSDLPNDEYYIGMEQDAQWRKDALDRIDQIRKGDICVNVVDAAGNAVSGAAVSLDMYEHEFEWGTALDPILLENSADADKYRQAVVKYFNSASCENHLKWNYYDAAPKLPSDMMDWCLKNGIRHLRGHALVWDTTYTPGNSHVPADIPGIFDNKAALDARIQSHIFDEAGLFADCIQEWDVTNELTRTDAYIRPQYGNEVLKDWYSWAREAAPNAELYMNEGGLRNKEAIYFQRLIPILQWAKENNLDFDGLGVQGHADYPYNPMEFYNMLTELGQYVDKIKITEFDVKQSFDKGAFQGNFTRDMLIAMFSHEKVEGIYMWGFWDWPKNQGNTPLFYGDWTLKPSGVQFEDLVYNKWRTREAGATDADGKYTTRGFYGDYDITVSYAGKTKTVQATCCKGQDNTVLIVLD